MMMNQSLSQMISELFSHGWAQFVSQDEVNLLAASVLFVGVSLLTFPFGADTARSLFYSGCRTLFQLSLLGFVFQKIIQSERLEIALVLVFLMTVVATQTLVKRIRVPYRGIYFQNFCAIALACWGFSYLGQVWIFPHETGSRSVVQILSITGILLGNSLTGISLGLHHWTREVSQRWEEIENYLALGVTYWGAVQHIIAESVRTALTPLINSMSVAGLVSFPGMMSGQILAGMDAGHAAKYQVVIMFLIAGATSTGVILGILGGFWSLFLRKRIAHWVPNRDPMRC